jgi:hypothetical protein
MEKVNNYIELLELIESILCENCQTKVQIYLVNLRKRRSDQLREQLFEITV